MFGRETRGCRLGQRLSSGAASIGGKGEKQIMRIAIIIGLVGVALVASAGEPSSREAAGPKLEAKICSPSWRLSVERRLDALQDQADNLESEVDEIRY